MMKTFAILSPLLFFFLLASFLGMPCALQAQQVPAIRIAPDQAFGGPLSAYFSDFEFIPLETTKESLLGAVDKLVVTDSSYIAGDWDTKCVYFFSKDGKLLNKVKLPREGSLGIDIAYEGDQRRVAIRAINWATEKGECTYYSKTGQPLNIAPVRIDGNKAILVYLGKGYQLGISNAYLNRGERARDSIYNLFTIYKNGEPSQNVLPYNQVSSLAFCRIMGSYILQWGHPIRVQDGSFYAAMPLTFTVYKIGLKEAVPAFRFVLPAERVVPRSLIERNNLGSIDSLYDQLRMDNRTILQISNIFFLNKYLSFKFIPKVYISKPSSESEYQYNFLYDTASKKLIGLERLTPDSLSYYLQPLGHIANRDGLDYYDGYFYTSLSALEILNQWDKTKDRGARYPPVLQEYFQTQNRKSNPVLVRMKLRQ